MRIRQTLNSVVFLKKARREKTWDVDFSHSELRLRGFERERELLYKNTQDPTVGGLRSKKGKRSTRGPRICGVSSNSKR